MKLSNTAFCQHIVQVAGKALGSLDPRVAVPCALVLERAEEAAYLAGRVRATNSGNVPLLRDLAEQMDARAARLREIAEAT